MHQIEILRAPYVLQLFFRIFGPGLWPCYTIAAYNTVWPTKIENRHFPRKLRVQSQIWVHITFFNFFFRIFWAGFQRHTLMYMFRRILFSFFWKKISSTIKLLQMWTKKSNPQNFIKHSCPKVASDLVCFWKFQKKKILHLVEKIFEFAKI